MDYHFLSKTILFQGVSPEEAEQMLSCLQAKEKMYKKDELIFCAGDVTPALGFVLSGSVLIESDDVWGNRSVLDRAGAGQIFAETYACVPGERLMVNVRAAEPVRVLFLDVGKVLHVCSGACSCHNKLIRNLLSISAQKNLNLSRRILHTSSKTIRGRILSYLSYLSMRAGSREFQIPFNRQQLADYLGVDRSAMSSELGKMQKEGILRTERNYFCLLEQKDEYS